MQISSRFTVALHIFTCVDTFKDDYKVTHSQDTHTAEECRTDQCSQGNRRNRTYKRFIRDNLL